MRKLILPFLAALLFSQGASAQALPYSNADCGISSLSGASQQLIAANPNRKYFLIFNSGNANAWVNLAGGTAATSGISSVVIGPSTSIVMNGNQIATNRITVIGTAAQPIACYEGR